MGLLLGLTIFLVAKAYRRKPSTGSEGLKGLEGHAKTDVLDGGQVFIHGEIWNAWSESSIKEGEKVVVEKEEHLKLKVRLK